MRRFSALLLAVVALACTGAYTALSMGPYELKILSPTATGLITGTPVMVKGFKAGVIDDISVQGDKALVSVTLDREFAPLHDGASASVIWKALLGERLLQITDGDAANAEIPSGGTLQGNIPAPVELDDVLSTLDPPTRERLASLVKRLDGTVAGSEQDTNETLRTAGPAIAALGNVLRGLGTDGEAIKQLVTQLNGTTSILAGRSGDVERIVQQLGDATAQTATRREQLGQVLDQVPGTLDRAQRVLGNVPGTVDEALPLLEDLRPATEKLQSVSGNLQPLLADLRPAIADLRPTLDSASELLRYTPGLIDSAHDTVPATNRAFESLTPAFEFLRPYTPELLGWMTNWNSAFANSDANGHFARIFVQGGLEQVNVNPGVPSPGVTRDLKPAPGSSVGQPWTDAFGSGER
ncbi:mce related protein [Pseudonocardia autotrophica]|nr:mce related protein [Pseudonocardia autotrophica]